MIDDDGDEIEDWELEEMRVERESLEALNRNYRDGHVVAEWAPRWDGFTIPEWLRINTTDDRKRYK